MYVCVNINIYIYIERERDIDASMIHHGIALEGPTAERLLCFLSGPGFAGSSLLYNWILDYLTYHTIAL